MFLGRFVDAPDNYVPPTDVVGRFGSSLGRCIVVNGPSSGPTIQATPARVCWDPGRAGQASGWPCPTPLPSGRGRGRLSVKLCLMRNK